MMGTETDKSQESLDSDRRLAPRVFIHWEVDIANDGNFLFAYITDISATGIFVRTNTPEPPGTMLQLRFAPTGEDALEVEGEVIWVNSYRPDDNDNLDPGMGIRFVNLEDGTQHVLNRWITRMALLNREDTEPKPNP